MDGWMDEWMLGHSRGARVKWSNSRISTGSLNWTLAVAAKKCYFKCWCSTFQVFFFPSKTLAMDLIPTIKSHNFCL